MDSILSVQHKDFTGDGQEFAKVEPSEKLKVSSTEKLFWDLAYLVKIYHGIIVRLHFIDRDEWN